MSADRIRVAWHWGTLGPYHFARMNAVARQPGVELLVTETTSSDDHGWKRSRDGCQFELCTLSSEYISGDLYRRTTSARLQILRRWNPDVIVESGYSEIAGREVVYRFRQIRPDGLALMWSETTAFDHERRWWRERLKRVLVQQFDGAVVAGALHADYLRALGMPAGRIAVIGGCVDNDYFAAAAEKLRGSPERRHDLGLPDNYFLFVGRFIPKKNVAALLRAYSLYCADAEARGVAPWDFVLVGAGPEDASLRGLAAHEPSARVHFLGLRQADELSIAYAFASCFVLPSLSEPWGLVVNEAMAASLPVLVSDRCGCAQDLVEEGENGYTFSPASDVSIAGALMRMTTADNLGAMGAKSRRLVDKCTVENFGARFVEHVHRLRSLGNIRCDTPVQRLFARALHRTEAIFVPTRPRL